MSMVMISKDLASIADLMDATGLAKGSLYKGFGDKKQLFMLALDSYLADANAALLECDASSASGCQALEQVFSGVIAMSTGGGVRRGCLSVNSAIELGPHDPTVRNRLRRNTREKERTFAAIIRRGIADGTLREDLNPEAAARCITTVTTGLQVRGKLGLSRDEGNETVAMTIDTFL
jgi:TetR/AcrR family transcriptional repressor of nem operon